MTTHAIHIEVAVALQRIQSLLELVLEEGITVGAALERSGVYEQYPEDGLRTLAVGIWGQPVDRDRIVRNGDRIELYRELEIDPRDARRHLAESGRTMGKIAEE